jgi:hypothetical protein
MLKRKINKLKTLKDRILNPIKGLINAISIKEAGYNLRVK